MRINEENVLQLEQQVLNQCDLYGRTEAEARDLLNYIAGVHDMASLVIDTIRKLKPLPMPQKEAKP